MFYGWTKGLMKDPFADDAVVSNCYLAMFELFTQVDYFIQDAQALSTSLNLYDVGVYGPTHIAENYAATFE